MRPRSFEFRGLEPRHLAKSARSILTAPGPVPNNSLRGLLSRVVHIFRMLVNRQVFQSRSSALRRCGCLAEERHREAPERREAGAEAQQRLGGRGAREPPHEARARRRVAVSTQHLRSCIYTPFLASQPVFIHHF